MIEIALSLVVKVPCAVITGMLMFAHFLWFVRGNYPFLQGRLLIFLLFFLGLPRPKYVIEATKCWLVGKPVSFVPTEDIKGLLQCAVGDDAIGHVFHKLLRISINNKVFYTEDYKRMSKRVSYACLKATVEWNLD